jgi:phosphatidylethanolamine/phosphatidyl-N-methylethanolamine N-methyltransferase
VNFAKTPKPGGNYGSVPYYYSTFYSKMMGEDSTGLMSILWRYPHRLIENRFKKQKFSKILEVGAGEGEHLLAANVLCDQYTLLDTDSKRLMKVKESTNFEISRVVADATDTKLQSDEYDRLISTCLIVHLANPEEALLEWRRVVKAGGIISIYIPCESGISLRTFRKIFSSRKASKLGYEGFDLYIARDHVSSAARIMALIDFVFRNDEILKRYRPIPIPSWYLNLFIIVEIRINK